MIEIICEIGINHNASIETAKNLIRMAKTCGADYVKFQKRDIETVYTKEFLDSPRESPWGNTQRDQKRALEFGQEQYEEIDIFCKNIGIPWFASAWDIKSLEFLDQFKCPHQKVASAMITHKDFLREVARRKIHTYISTGMSTMKVIEDAVDIFARQSCDFTLLHSTSLYPCPDEEAHLEMIKILLNRFGPPIGFSNHCPGILASILAVQEGATVIEVHITLDRASYGSDQAASLEKHGLEQLIKECRGVKICYGDGRKMISQKENEVAKRLRYWKERED